MPRGTREETSPLPAIIGLEESGLVVLVSDLPFNTSSRAKYTKVRWNFS